MKNIVIIGADDLGREVVWLVEEINKVSPKYVIIGFLDDDQNKINETFYGYKVLGNVAYLKELNKDTPMSAVVAITAPEKKKKVLSTIKEICEWENLIHPSAVIADTSKYGIGNLFFPHVTISVNTEIGNFGLFHINSTICSDCVIGDYSSVLTGATISGKTHVGECCFMEAGSTIYPNKNIGDNVHLSIGAIATKDYKDSARVDEGGKGIFLFQ